ncbi:MAG: TIGR02147 family protein [Bdellovibrionales bacterium]|nr:TIGR02147 family protein [Bdellovibrionales bacterium]
MAKLPGFVTHFCIPNRIQALQLREMGYLGPVNLPDYRNFLKEELVARQKRNRSYSARAMARDLKVSPAYLSQVVSGSRALSEDRAFQISTQLSWPKWKKTLFLRLVRYGTLKTPELRSAAADEISGLLLRAGTFKHRAGFKRINHDEFKIVSDWVHLAIFEMASYKDFDGTPKWVADRLGVSVADAKAALMRLVAIELFRLEEGKFKRSSDNFRMTSTSSEAIRGFHRQHLRKAEKALDAQDPSIRDFSGTTMAIEFKKIPRAKALIRRFNTEMNQLMSTADADAVYHLAVQLYRIDSEPKTESPDRL